MGQTVTTADYGHRAFMQHPLSSSGIVSSQIVIKLCILEGGT